MDGPLFCYLEKNQLTQTIEPVAEEREAPAISLAEALILRTETATPPASEESVTDALEKAATAEESAPATLENDAAPEGEQANGRPSRREIADIKAENETLKLTQAEFDQRVQDAIREADEAKALAAQLKQAEDERVAAFHSYAGSDREYAELAALATEVGARVGADPYATVTEDEQQKLQRFREIKPRQEYQDLFTSRAWSTVLDAQRSELGAAIAACPGVDAKAIEASDTFTGLYRHFYEAGAASKQDEIDRLTAQLQGYATKANSAVRSPVVGGASGSPAGRDDGRAMSLGEALMARLEAQGS